MKEIALIPEIERVKTLEDCLRIDAGLLVGDYGLILLSLFLGLLCFIATGFIKTLDLLPNMAES